MKNETATWLRYARENLESAHVLLKSALFNPCLQNVQQSVEKTLKAACVERGLLVKKTHNIRELVGMIRATGVEVDLDDDEQDLLDSIYIPSKYPLGSVLPDFDPDETICQRCVSIAERVFDTISQLLQ